MPAMELEWRRIDLVLRRPFRTATAYRTSKQTIWVQISHENAVGWGEAVPVDTYGQSLESAEQTLRSIQPLLRDRDPRHIEPIVRDLTRQFDDQRATIAAIDAALHDWVGKRDGLRVSTLLGLDPTRSPLTSFTIGIDELDQIADKVHEAAEYPILKVKLGTPDDRRILETIRKHAPSKTLRVDANTAWPPREALDRLAMVAEFGVELVEQPLPAADLDGLRRLKNAALCPIIADESCVRPRDVAALAGVVDGINIKLSKCGGIREALSMIHTARALGLRVMLGCMIESSLGISAAAQLAPLADWIDLDGHLLLSQAPFTSLGGARGKLTLGEMPGLGVALG
jgi:L-alanine-DL-glutamate epimerase-like enolase superfamily enzyme